MFKQRSLKGNTIFNVQLIAVNRLCFAYVVQRSPLSLSCMMRRSTNIGIESRKELVEWPRPRGIHFLVVDNILDVSENVLHIRSQYNLSGKYDLWSVIVKAVQIIGLQFFFKWLKLSYLNVQNNKVRM